MSVKSIPEKLLNVFFGGWLTYNQLTSLDVSANTALTYLRCNNNLLISLNVKNGNNSNFTPISWQDASEDAFKASGNPDLTCIQVDDASYSTDNWTNKDATAGYSTDCSAISITTNSVSSITSTSATLVGNIPSDGGSAVTERGFVYSSDSTEALTIENTNVTKVTSGAGIGVFSQDITVRAGITYHYKAYATNDSSVTVYGDVVSFGTDTTDILDSNFEQTLIDLGFDTNGKNGNILNSDAVAVVSLTISRKSIANLSGIEAFTALTYLNCGSNQLRSLDVSANTALTNLYCSSNQLTSLDVSANTALTLLNCDTNQLTSLDVSANTALTLLNCHTNQLTSLDVSANTALTYLDCYRNQLSELDVSTNTALTYLYCYSNQLTSLDVSTNTALITLWCWSNQLTSLDVSANTALTYLYCYSNQLSELNVSANTALAHLWCYSNQLTSLDVANGNNSNFISFSGNNRVADSFYAGNNPNLTCIQVDDASYSTINWTNKDEAASYSEDCRPPTIMGGMNISSTGETVTMQTNKPVTLTNNVENADFTVTSTLNGSTITHQVTNVESGSIVLTVTPVIPPGAIISVSYDPTQGNSTEAITDSEGNPMSSFTNVTSSLSNRDFKITNISVSPNPTNGILNITVAEKAYYRLLNIRGQTLKTGILDVGKSSISLSSFARGIYLLNIKTSKGSFMEKIIRN